MLTSLVPPEPDLQCAAPRSKSREISATYTLPELQRHYNTAVFLRSSLLGTFVRTFVQCVDERLRVERSEVGHLLTDPDEAHRQLELVADAQDHATLGRPVELGEHDAAHLHRLLEDLRLLDRVLPVG